MLVFRSVVECSTLVCDPVHRVTWFLFDLHFLFEWWVVVSCVVDWLVVPRASIFLNVVEWERVHFGGWRLQGRGRFEGDSKQCFLKEHSRTYLQHQFPKVLKYLKLYYLSIPASSKGCQMVPKGCQFTIPYGLIGTPLKVQVFTYICIYIYIYYTVIHTFFISRYKYSI